VLIDGQYPNYSRVIPENQKFYFELEKADFLSAIKRVTLLVDQKIRRIYLELSPGMLVITSQESNIGVAREEVPCQYDGDNVTIAMDYTRIEEPLKVMDTDRVRFEFTEVMRPVTVKSVPESDYFHIIMPMQMMG
jgi:DNA polymerase-3 subunit beta